MTYRLVSSGTIRRLLISVAAVAALMLAGTASAADPFTVDFEEFATLVQDSGGTNRPVDDNNPGPVASPGNDAFTIRGMSDSLTGFYGSLTGNRIATFSDFSGGLGWSDDIEIFRTDNAAVDPTSIQIVALDLAGSLALSGNIEILTKSGSTETSIGNFGVGMVPFPGSATIDSLILRPNITSGTCGAAVGGCAFAIDNYIGVTPDADPPGGGGGIPEPATASLLALSGLAMLRRKRL
jgi:MprA protease rhombosortase-interaction domain-containing protein